VRWVYVVDTFGEVETNFSDQPTHCPTLRVEIISAGPNYVEEQTWTHNRKYRHDSDSHPEFQSVPPPGKGWALAENTGSSCRYIRRRDRRKPLTWYEDLIRGHEKWAKERGHGFY
jgi:hypothetical protein